ncbi:MAG: hypothetical protein IRZ16_13595 [Myxococcaceae bacterium]|nr:hypothetical protein [Myxococcaceae bacterium]
MADTIDLSKLDKRTVDRYIQMGLVNEKDWEKYIKSLPDLSDKCEPISTKMFEDEEEEAVGGAEPAETATATE